MPPTVVAKNQNQDHDASAHRPRSVRSTQIIPIDVSKAGRVHFSSPNMSYLEPWTFELSSAGPDAARLYEAASQLRQGNRPVAFPTETVYGLGADATRSSAVLSIYAAKQRPSDNPLIVHVSSLAQLRRLLSSSCQDLEADDRSPDPIPPIYHPLISRFWPGPLTILLPLPRPSPLAPQVTASLPTFAVRMPSSLLALILIHLADVPLAAPSANASTKPSPTTANHVLNDLSGRIDLILDGGPCEVGVESTVVDGLSNPPVILRPGGVSINMLRQCPGWEKVMIGYKDGAENGIPRAPGMKYKHYSPKAKVILVQGDLDTGIMNSYCPGGSIGVLATKTWQAAGLEKTSSSRGDASQVTIEHSSYPSNGMTPNRPKTGKETNAANISLFTAEIAPVPTVKLLQVPSQGSSPDALMHVWMVELGKDTGAVARGLFFALRELDQKNVDAIFVESIDDGEGDAAAAVMNRLRKAAELRIET
ncbi:MAG: hypothetical protein Q9191_000306 [Dirinaria sp. TL-2023a]